LRFIEIVSSPEDLWRIEMVRENLDQLSSSRGGPFFLACPFFSGLAKRAGPDFVIPYALGIPMEVQANGKDERAFGRGSIESTSDLMR
jgi:hypothetical protein